MVSQSIGLSISGWINAKQLRYNPQDISQVAVRGIEEFYPEGAGRILENAG
jgi:hypothetical protein